MSGIKQDTSLTFSIADAKPDIQRLLAGVNHPSTPEPADSPHGDRASSDDHDKSSSINDDQDMSNFINDDSSSDGDVRAARRARKTDTGNATTTSMGNGTPGSMAPPPITPRADTPKLSVGRTPESPLDRDSGTPPVNGVHGLPNMRIIVERANLLTNSGPSTPGLLTPSTGGSNASKLKRTFTEAMGTTAASGNKLVAERDPENHEIKRLRDVEGLKWGEIADKLNKARIAAGKVPGLTGKSI